LSNFGDEAVATFNDESKQFGAVFEKKGTPFLVYSHLKIGFYSNCSKNDVMFQEEK